MRLVGSVSLPSHHLPQQLEHRQQARFGADEGALSQAFQPGQSLFGGRGQVEMRLVGTGRIELAQPALVVGGPVVKILRGATRKDALA
jgi:hypothetical protein